MRVTTDVYDGEIRREYHSEELLGRLADLPSLLQADAAQLIAGGRNSNIRIKIALSGGELDVLVKQFGSQSNLKNWVDTKFRTTKAQRSYQAALHLWQQGVCTPAPIGYLERREGNHLLESYFLAVYEQEQTGFNEVLLYYLHHNPLCSQIMPLLQDVAKLCRNMHDTGYVHADLGNQNILFTGNVDAGFHSPKIIDLNRGRIHPQLSLQQRGQDLARLNLPSNLKLMFLDMYWGGPSPDELLKSHRKHAQRFAFRVRSRKLRHPFREARIARADSQLPADRKMPAARDLWIWDDYSDQPLAALDRRERSRNYPFGRGMRMVLDMLRFGPAIWLRYRQQLRFAFSTTIEMKDRIGMAVAPDSSTLDRELELLAGLGPVPVLVRLARQDDPETIEARVQLIKELRGRGHGVKVAMLQDRHAVKHPQSWQQFVFSILDRVASDITSIEFGHAINRVKWGLWSFSELRSFYGVLPDLQRRYPNLEITGPATIDFEYPFMLSALRLWPKQVKLAAVSHHLYVDRRGAPENLQNGFGAVAKFALAKAVAAGSGVEVSEVNWPIKGTGVHSPVTPPFNYPESATQAVFDSGVSESDAADFMIRYLVLAVCSGLVERVYWWRLLARGYGLVDIDDDGETRERPGYQALKQFLATLGSARLTHAELPDAGAQHKGHYLFKFQRPDGEQVALCWSHGDALKFPPQLQYGHVEDRAGNILPSPPVELSGSPVYLREVKSNEA